MSSCVLVFAGVFLLIANVYGWGGRALESSLESYEGDASCKYRVSVDTMEGRNPRTITQLKCLEPVSECICEGLMFPGLNRGRCVQLYQNLHATYLNGTEVNLEVKYGCICVPGSPKPSGQGRPRTIYPK